MKNIKNISVGQVIQGKCKKTNKIIVTISIISAIIVLFYVVLIINFIKLVSIV